MANPYGSLFRPPNLVGTAQPPPVAPPAAPAPMPSFGNAAAAAPSPQPPPAVPPTHSAPPMPQFGQPVSVKPSGLQIATLIPTLLAGIKDPIVMGAALAGFHKGQDAKRAKLETDQQASERRALAQAKFYGDVLTEAQSFDDPIAFAHWKEAMRPMAQLHGVDMESIPFSEEKKAAKDRKLVSDALDIAVKRHGPEILNREDVSIQLADGRTISIATAQRMVGGGATDQSGKAVPVKVTPEKDPLAPNTSEESFYATFAKEHGVKTFGELSSALQKQARKEWMQSDDYAKNPNSGINEYRNFLMTDKLQQQWTKLTTPIRTMRQQYGLMTTGLQRFRSGDKNGGSQAVLVTFQKILDPNSVVRESEYARTSDGQALLDRIQGYATRLAQGGTTLTDAEMAAMVETGKQMLQSAQAYAQGQKTRMEGTAKEFGIRPELIFDDVLNGTEPAKPVAAPPPGNGNAVSSALAELERRRAARGAK